MNHAARDARGAGPTALAAGSGAAPGLVGVLGGMGPMATVDFLQKVLNATPAACDQEHVPLIVCSIPQVPDRTAAYRGEGASPLPAMLACGQRLVAAGAGVVVVPCNTAHLWFDELQEQLGLPMLHVVDAALADVAARVGPARIGILATDATLASGLYVNRPQGGGAPLQWVLPTAVEMIELVMPGIGDVKGGDLASGGRRLLAAAHALVRRGAQALVLACTEVPLVVSERDAQVPVIDATDALARAAVAWSRAQVEASALAA
jgi:aspartate racemase